MIETKKILGIAACYSSKESLVDAARKAKQQGYVHIQTYSPFPIEELDEVLNYREKILPWAIFIGGLIGGLGGFFMQYGANVWFLQLDIGGRPYNSWPAFIPITFELTILVAAITGFIGLILKCGLPELYHPVFNIPHFERASLDQFYLCIMFNETQSNSKQIRQFLNGTAAQEIYPIEA